MCHQSEIYDWFPRRMGKQKAKLLQGLMMFTVHFCKSDWYYGYAVKSAYKKRSAFFALQFAPCSLMDVKPGRCQLKIPGGWMYLITGTCDEAP